MLHHALYWNASGLHFTLDGSEPNEKSALYAEPITITASTTVKAIAVTSKGVKSHVVEAKYHLASHYVRAAGLVMGGLGVASPQLSTNSVTSDVCERLSCRIERSFPSGFAPSRRRCRVTGRCPAVVN